MMQNFEDRTKAIGQRWLDDAFVNKPSNLPECVYHYTDAGGLKGMLDGGALWATDHRFLNDKQELGHLRVAVRDVLHQEAANGSDTVRSLCRKALAYSELESTHEVFIFSTSEQSDDLSQWRGYAREGRGFTIGFGAAELERFVDKLPFSCGFGKVDYDPLRQIQAIHRVIAEIDREVVAELKQADVDRDAIIDDAARTLDAVVEVRAAISKHASFRAENEWRVVAMLSRSSPEAAINVRTSGDRLVPFVRIECDEKLPISRVGIGPGFIGAEDISAVRTVCGMNSYDPDIYFADTPYRRL